MSPKVSVLMPVKNGMPFLEESVSSILTQTLTDFEFIIIDDYSDDNSLDFLESLHDKRIKIIKNKGEPGIVSAINLGFDEANSELIARMDSDDIAEPERLELQYSHLNKNPENVLLGTSISVIDECGAKKKSHSLQAWYNTGHTDSEIRQQLFMGNCLNHPSVMFRKNAALQCGGYYKQDFTGAADYEFILRIRQTGKLHKLKDHLLRYRFHSRQMSSIKRNEQLQTDVRLKIMLLSENRNTLDRPIIVLGGGNGGKLVVAELKRKGFNCVGVLDNDASKHNSSIYEVPIVGGFKLIPEFESAFFVIATSPGRKIAEELLKQQNLKLNKNFQPVWF